MRREDARPEGIEREQAEQAEQAEQERAAAERRWWERGAAVVEHAMAVVLLSLACLMAIGLLEGEADKTMQAVSGEMVNPTTQATPPPTTPPTSTPPTTKPCTKWWC